MEQRKIRRKDWARAAAIIAFVFLLAAPANAVIFKDNFSGYANNITIIDRTDDNSQWTPELDANYVWNDTNYLKFGQRGLNIFKDNEQSSDPRGSIGRTLSPTLDLSDYNSGGVAYYWIKVDGNVSNVWRADVRIGKSVSEYYSLAFVFSTFHSGYTLAHWDFNCVATPCFIPGGGGGGSDPFADISYLDLAVHNELDGNTTGSDMNAVWNTLWVEKPGGAFQGAWKPMLTSGATKGWAIPINEGNNWAMQLANDDEFTGGNGRVRNSRWVYQGLEDYNIADFNLHLQARIKKPFSPDPTFGIAVPAITKLAFDVVNQTNLSSVFMEENVDGTDINIGVEQIIAGVRSVTRVPVTYERNTYHTLKAEMNGLDVNLFFDGALALTATLTSRNDGNVGIFSQSNTSIVTDWAAELNNAGTFSQALSFGGNSATTTFVFNVATNRGHTITYGGSCTSGAFFFNEIDANFDPDVDGNAAKVKPSAVRRTGTTFTTDYNYAGNVSTSDRNVAYDGSLGDTYPTDKNAPSTAFTTTDYAEVSTDDTSYQLTTNTGDIPEPRATQRYVFKLNNHEQVVRDINFMFLGQALENTGSCSAGAGGDSDFNVYIWNYDTSAFTHLNSYTGTGGGLGLVAPKYLEARVSGNVTAYIANDNNVTFLVQGKSSAGGDTRCLFADLVNLKTTQYRQSQSTFCQSSTFAPMTVSNVGNVSLNVDGNFTSIFSGVDANLILKVWQGTGSGCGTDGNGLGGWRPYCGVTTFAPEARWEFDYDSNVSRFPDSSGNNHHGTFVGAPNYITGTNCYDGNCLQKVHQYDLNVENNVTYLDDNFTIATWVFFEIGSTDTSDILTTNKGTAGKLVKISIDQDIDQIQCQADTGGPTSGSYDGGLLDGDWHQIGCTRKTDGNVVIYLDGAWVANSTQTTGDLDLVGGGNAYLSLAYGVQDSTLRLDRTEIYTRAFDANEMSQLYALGRATPDDWKTTAPTQTVCRQYDYTNANVGARLITTLLLGDTNQLCFSGDFNSFVSGGDHNKSFQTGTDYS